MTTIVDRLIRSGLTRRQAGILGEGLAGGSPGGGSDDSIYFLMSASTDAPIPVDYDTNMDPDGNGVWVSTNTFWPDYSLEELTGTAITWDAGDFEIGYAQDGIYLNSLSLRFDPGVGYNDALVGNFKVVVGDQQFLGHTFDRVGASAVDSFSLTWMAVQQAGDTNTTPYIERVVGPNPLRVIAASYLSVRVKTS